MEEREVFSSPNEVYNFMALGKLLENDFNSGCEVLTKLSELREALKGMDNIPNHRERADITRDKLMQFRMAINSYFLNLEKELNLVCKNHNNVVSYDNKIKINVPVNVIEIQDTFSYDEFFGFNLYHHNDYKFHLTLDKKMLVEDFFETDTIVKLIVTNIYIYFKTACSGSSNRPFAEFLHMYQGRYNKLSIRYAYDHISSKTDNLGILSLFNSLCYLIESIFFDTYMNPFKLMISEVVREKEASTLETNDPTVEILYKANMNRDVYKSITYDFYNKMIELYRDEHNAANRSSYEFKELCTRLNLYGNKLKSGVYETLDTHKIMIRLLDLLFANINMNGESLEDPELVTQRIVEYLYSIEPVLKTKKQREELKQVLKQYGGNKVQSENMLESTIKEKKFIKKYNKDKNAVKKVISLYEPRVYEMQIRVKNIIDESEAINYIREINDIIDTLVTISDTTSIEDEKLMKKLSELINQYIMLRSKAANINVSKYSNMGIFTPKGLSVNPYENI